MRYVTGKVRRKRIEKVVNYYGSSLIGVPLFGQYGDRETEAYYIKLDDGNEYEIRRDHYDAVIVGDTTHVSVQEWSDYRGVALFVLGLMVLAVVCA